MKKILLIAFREFFLKIRNKLFLVTTLLLPIGIAVFYGAIFFFGTIAAMLAGGVYIYGTGER